MAVFEHCSVLFELKGLPFKDKKKIKYAVTDNGGNMTFVVNKQCSLVVASGVSSLSPSRLRNIVKHQIPVVGVDYVHRCLEANCRLPVEDFTLDISTSENSLPNVYKDKWSQSKDTTPTSQTIPLQLFNVSQRAESPQDRGRIIKNKYRVYAETDHGLPKFPENFQVAKYSIFQKPNSHCWYLLELQSAKSDRGRQYRVVTYRKDDIQSKGAAVRDQIYFLSTSEEATEVFQDLTECMKAEGLKQQRDFCPQEMGSTPLQQLLLEEKLNTGTLSPEVGLFVELLWQEALGCINRILKTPVHKISLNDVTRAEGLLLQVQRKITEHKLEEASTLWFEYCALIPKQFDTRMDLNQSSVSKELDLCQLIRDILNVSEMTLGSTVLSSVGKYRALRCGIEAVPPDSSEFEAVTSLLRCSKIQVHQILRVNRAPELQNFKSELGNIKSLLHSSKPQNFVGILSRGLLMPHVAVAQHGIKRTDAGNLGCGIYFTDDIKTTLKYSECSSTDGSRLMLVCDVALGRCKDFVKKDITLTQAPEGHDSVYGVQNKPGLQSEFTDNEYVVYSTDQVKLQYVVRLSMEGEDLKNVTPEIVGPEEPSLPSPEEGIGTVEDGISDIKNPFENVTAGLLNSSGQQIPLQAVHIKCKLMDLLAQVIIFQKYTNESLVPIEAKYVFPLDDSAAVSGFEAFINGKHVVGQVKEKETARREYKQAIEKGHGAYLMDQDAPEVFTISVGNLPPGATVLIKVTFVSELIVKDGSVFFSLPSSVAPWQESAALNQTTQVTVEKVCVTDERANTREFNLDMSIEMPREITEVKCTTHKVKIKKTDCKAVVSVLPGEVMGPEGFQLLVTLTEVHVPRMWVEKHPSKDSQACMLVFYPKFEAPSCITSDEVVLLLDASQSMKGESLNTAQMLALQILKTLEQNVQLNVIFFGTDHTEAFLSARPIVEARHEAKNFIKHFSSAGGSTELWRPLLAMSLLPPTRGTRNLLLLSDGHIQNPELTLQLIRENSTHSRLFTCGLSPTANRHMLRALAQAGGGAYEFFDTKSKHTWSEKVTSQIKRMLAPGARSVSVKWQQFNPNAPPPVQAPKQLHALFNDCHTLVFGFVPHCTQATLLGNLSGEEIKTMVSTSELQKTKGTFLHKLTARAIIRDFEDGSLDSNAVLHEEKKAELKSFVIEMSKEFSILSQFTSFVAIEERGSEEERGFTDIPKLIAEEDVDFLPYMSWAEEKQKVASSSSSGSETSSLGSDERTLYEDMEDELALFCSISDAESLPDLILETADLEIGPPNSLKKVRCFDKGFGGASLRKMEEKNKLVNTSASSLLGSISSRPERMSLEEKAQGDLLPEDFAMLTPLDLSSSHVGLAGPPAVPTTADYSSPVLHQRAMSTPALLSLQCWSQPPPPCCTPFNYAQDYTVFQNCFLATGLPRFAHVHELSSPVFRSIHPSIHPFSSAYPGPGRGGSSLSRDSQTSFTPDTSSSSSRGDPEAFPGQPRDIVPPALSSKLEMVHLQGSSLPPPPPILKPPTAIGAPLLPLSPKGLSEPNESDRKEHCSESFTFGQQAHPPPLLAPVQKPSYRIPTELPIMACPLPDDYSSSYGSASVMATQAIKFSNDVSLESSFTLGQQQPLPAPPLTKVQKPSLATRVRPPPRFTAKFSFADYEEESFNTSCTFSLDTAQREQCLAPPITLDSVTIAGEQQTTAGKMKNKMKKEKKFILLLMSMPHLRWRGQMNLK
ncbi:hypothetical protein NL108_002520 [Boleophthalmus pectinirostris]|nr:hypothetical protein NL108_002520 [Boleophthalmus pectinirostris]